MVRLVNDKKHKLFINVKLLIHKIFNKTQIISTTSQLKFQN
jgi:hypothetical protein